MSLLNKVPRIGDTRVEFTFDSESDLDRWVTTADSDWGEGYSTCALTRSPSSGKALFSGELSTRVPQDGRIKRAGYVNLGSVEQLKSFGRKKQLDWMWYTDFVMRVRGDGRTYTMNVHAPGEYDLTWHDVWHYPLYTRGGPYWQYVRIPFGKFCFGHKGKFVDEQQRLDVRKATGISFTLMDNIDGPFSLELDYIGLYLENPRFVEKLRWEEYIYPTAGFTQIA